MKTTRREFFSASLGTGGVLIFGSAAAAEPSQTQASGLQSVYLQVRPDNHFVLIFDKAEMGQGVLTGQATLFGEEADIPPDQFEMQPAPVDPVYGTMNGAQITGGSTSTVERWTVLRKAGAAYRQAVMAAAAQFWKTSVEQIASDSGYVVNKATGARKPYAAFNAILSELEFPSDPPLKPDSEFKYIGRWQQSLDAREKSTGTARFGIDFDHPDLKNALVLRSPIFGARLGKVNLEAIKTIPGVVDVVSISTGVAIICDRFWQCLNAKNQIDPQWISWQIDDALRISSTDLHERYRQALGEPPESDPSKPSLTAEYSLPFLVHAPLEPQNCAAWKQKDRFDIWAPTQAPTQIRQLAADAAGYDRSRVFVHTSKFLGGGFGRRGANDFAQEAIEIACEVAYPVKLIWTRADDMRYSPLRPMGVHRLHAQLDRDKGIKAWRHDFAAQSIMNDIVPPFVKAALPGWLPEGFREFAQNATQGLLSLADVMKMSEEGSLPDYAFDAQVQSFRQELKVPTLYWRSVGHSHHGFVIESFLDEVCHALERDPLAMRLELLLGNAKAHRVVQQVAEQANWQNPPMTKNRALGLAYHKSFGTYVAQVADVEVLDNRIKIHRVTCVVDCGTVVNPAIVEAQVRSGVIFGLTAALYGKISFQDGQIEQENFDSYRLLSLGECPEIDVHVVSSKDPPTGIGEPGVPPIAAAVGNAIFRATGQRLRTLPFALTQA